MDKYSNGPKILFLIQTIQDDCFFDGKRNRGRGHAQKNQNISFNTIQPYPDGELQGLYPAIVIQP